MGPTIVCAVDVEDDAAGQPLTLAATLAARLDRPLVVAHVAPPHTGAADQDAAVVALAPAVPYPYPLPADAGELDAARDDLRRRVERLVVQHGVHDAEIEVQFGVDVAEVLRQIAVDRAAELLVVGSRGHGTVRAALLGSTSHALAGNAPCPVVVVPPSG